MAQSQTFSNDFMQGADNISQQLDRYDLDSYAINRMDEISEECDSIIDEYLTESEKLKIKYIKIEDDNPTFEKTVNQNEFLIDAFDLNKQQLPNPADPDDSDDKIKRQLEIDLLKYVNFVDYATIEKRKLTAEYRKQSLIKIEIEKLKVKKDLLDLENSKTWLSMLIDNKAKIIFLGTSVAVVVNLFVVANLANPAVWGGYFLQIYNNKILFNMFNDLLYMLNILTKSEQFNFKSLHDNLQRAIKSGTNPNNLDGSKKDKSSIVPYNDENFIKFVIDFLSGKYEKKELDKSPELSEEFNKLKEKYTNFIQFTFTKKKDSSHEDEEKSEGVENKMIGFKNIPELTSMFGYLKSILRLKKIAFFESPVSNTVRPISEKVSEIISKIPEIPEMVTNFLDFDEFSQNAPPTQAPGTQAPGTQAPGTQAPGTQTSGWNMPENGTDLIIKIMEIYNNPDAKSKINALMTTFQIARNVTGYVYTTADIIKKAPDINSNFIYKTMSDGFIHSNTSRAITYVASQNVSNQTLSILNAIGATEYLKSSGSALQQIPFIGGVFTGENIEGVFISTINSLITSQVTGQINGYFNKIEKESGVSLTAMSGDDDTDARKKKEKEEREKKKKDPILEIQNEIELRAKYRDEDYTNEEIIELLEQKEPDPTKEYYNYMSRGIKFFYKKFKELKKNPVKFIEVLFPTFALYFTLKNILMGSLMTIVITSFQEIVYSGFLHSPIIKLGSEENEIKINIASIVKILVQCFYGGDEKIHRDIRTLQREFVTSVIHDLDLLLKDIFKFINENISNKPYIKKYIDKIINSWFGKFLNKFITLVYDILLIPTLTTKLTKMTTHGILEVKILDLLVNDEEQCKKVLLFVNHKISNLINSVARLEFLSELTTTVLELTDINKILYKYVVPYYNLVDGYYRYDIATLDSLTGSILEIKPGKPEQKFKIILDNDIDKNTFKIVDTDKIIEKLLTLIDENTSKYTSTDASGNIFCNNIIFSCSNDEKLTNIFFYYYYQEFLDELGNTKTSYSDYKEWLTFNKLRQITELVKSENGTYSDSFQLAMINKLLLSGKFMHTTQEDETISIKGARALSDFIIPTKMPKAFNLGTYTEILGPGVVGPSNQISTKDTISNFLSNFDTNIEPEIETIDFKQIMSQDNFLVTSRNNNNNNAPQGLVGNNVVDDKKEEDEETLQKRQQYREKQNQMRFSKTQEYGKAFFGFTYAPVKYNVIDFFTVSQLLQTLTSDKKINSMLDMREQLDELAKNDRILAYKLSIFDGTQRKNLSQIARLALEFTNTFNDKFVDKNTNIHMAYLGFDFNLFKQLCEKEYRDTIDGLRLAMPNTTSITIPYSNKQPQSPIDSPDEITQLILNTSGIKYVCNDKKGKTHLLYENEISADTMEAVECSSNSLIKLDITNIDSDLFFKLLLRPETIAKLYDPVIGVIQSKNVNIFLTKLKPIYENLIDVTNNCLEDTLLSKYKIIDVFISLVKEDVDLQKFKELIFEPKILISKKETYLGESLPTESLNNKGIKPFIKDYLREISGIKYICPLAKTSISSSKVIFLDENSNNIDTNNFYDCPNKQPLNWDSNFEDVDIFSIIFRPKILEKISQTPVLQNPLSKEDADDFAKFISMIKPIDINTETYMNKVYEMSNDITYYNMFYPEDIDVFQRQKYNSFINFATLFSSMAKKSEFDVSIKKTLNKYLSISITDGGLDMSKDVLDEINQLDELCSSSVSSSSVTIYNKSPTDIINYIKKLSFDALKLGNVYIDVDCVNKSSSLVKSYPYLCDKFNTHIRKMETARTVLMQSLQIGTGQLNTIEQICNDGTFNNYLRDIREHIYLQEQFIQSIRMFNSEIYYKFFNENNKIIRDNIDNFYRGYVENIAYFYEEYIDSKKRAQREQEVKFTYTPLDSGVTKKETGQEEQMRRPPPGPPPLITPPLIDDQKITPEKIAKQTEKDAQKIAEGQGQGQGQGQEQGLTEGLGMDQSLDQSQDLGESQKIDESLSLALALSQLFGGLADMWANFNSKAKPSGRESIAGNYQELNTEPDNTINEENIEEKCKTFKDWYWSMQDNKQVIKTITPNIYNEKDLKFIQKHCSTDNLLAKTSKTIVKMFDLIITGIKMGINTLVVALKAAAIVVKAVPVVGPPASVTLTILAKVFGAIASALTYLGICLQYIPHVFFISLLKRNIRQSQKIPHITKILLAIEANLIFGLKKYEEENNILPVACDAIFTLLNFGTSAASEIRDDVEGLLKKYKPEKRRLGIQDREQFYNGDVNDIKRIEEFNLYGAIDIGEMSLEADFASAATIPEDFLSSEEKNDLMDFELEVAALPNKSITDCNIFTKTRNHEFNFLKILMYSITRNPTNINYLLNYFQCILLGEPNFNIVQIGIELVAIGVEIGRIFKSIAGKLFSDPMGALSDFGSLFPTIWGFIKSQVKLGSYITFMTIPSNNHRIKRLFGDFWIILAENKPIRGIFLNQIFGKPTSENNKRYNVARDLVDSALEDIRLDIEDNKIKWKNDQDVEILDRRSNIPSPGLIKIECESYKNIHKDPDPFYWSIEKIGNDLYDTTNYQINIKFGDSLKTKKSNKADRIFILEHCVPEYLDTITSIPTSDIVEIKKWITTIEIPRIQEEDDYSWGTILDSEKGKNFYLKEEVYDVIDYFGLNLAIELYNKFIEIYQKVKDWWNGTTTSNINQINSFDAYIKFKNCKSKQSCNKDKILEELLLNIDDTLKFFDVDAQINPKKVISTDFKNSYEEIKRDFDSYKYELNSDIKNQKLDYLVTSMEEFTIMLDEIVSDMACKLTIPNPLISLSNDTPPFYMAELKDKSIVNNDCAEEDEAVSKYIKETKKIIKWYINSVKIQKQLKEKAKKRIENAQGDIFQFAMSNLQLSLIPDTDKSAIEITTQKQNAYSYYIKPCNDDEFFTVKTIDVVVRNIKNKEYIIECIKKKELTFDYTQLEKLNNDFKKKQKPFKDEKEIEIKSFIKTYIETTFLNEKTKKYLSSNDNNIDELIDNIYSFVGKDKIDVNDIHKFISLYFVTKQLELETDYVQPSLKKLNDKKKDIFKSDKKILQDLLNEKLVLVGEKDVLLKEIESIGKKKIQKPEKDKQKLIKRKRIEEINRRIKEIEENPKIKEIEDINRQIKEIEEEQEAMKNLIKKSNEETTKLEQITELDLCDDATFPFCKMLKDVVNKKKYIPFEFMMHEFKTYNSEIPNEDDPYFILLYLKLLELCTKTRVYVELDEENKMKVIKTDLLNRYLTHYSSPSIPNLNEICDDFKTSKEFKEIKKFDKLYSKQKFKEKIKNYFYYVLERQNVLNQYNNFGFFVDTSDIVFDVDGKTIKKGDMKKTEQLYNTLSGDQLSQSKEFNDKLLTINDYGLNLNFNEDGPAVQETIPLFIPKDELTKELRSENPSWLGWVSGIYRYVKTYVSLQEWLKWKEDDEAKVTKFNKRGFQKEVEIKEDGITKKVNVKAEYTSYEHSTKITPSPPPILYNYVFDQQDPDVFLQNELVNKQYEKVCLNSSNEIATCPSDHNYYILKFDIQHYRDSFNDFDLNLHVKDIHNHNPKIKKVNTEAENKAKMLEFLKFLKLNNKLITDERGNGIETRLEIVGIPSEIVTKNIDFIETGLNSIIEDVKNGTITDMLSLLERLENNVYEEDDISLKERSANSNFRKDRINIQLKNSDELYQYWSKTAGQTPISYLSSLTFKANIPPINIPTTDSNGKKIMKQYEINSINTLKQFRMDDTFTFLLYDFPLHFFNINSNLAYNNGKLRMINYDNLKASDEIVIMPSKNDVRDPIFN